MIEQSHATGERSIGETLAKQQGRVHVHAQQIDFQINPFGSVTYAPLSSVSRTMALAHSRTQAVE
jgi:hypothetical protein